nr:MAG TPA: hypothetical protein [Bacteriophage sp.]
MKNVSYFSFPIFYNFFIVIFLYLYISRVLFLLINSFI